ncbi:MAG: TerC/Alx family metal homeostasis membrane protein [Candidatus Latescibacterota bacterium]|nr:MAG: TerC/Alx family metal homeostasis membrane protein [Candidatus Latescibacterota bacterium]
MIWIWAGFILLVLAMLALDLGVFHRRAHVVSMKEALVWSTIWTIVGLLFAVFVYYGYENHWEGLGKTPDPVDRMVNGGFTATMKYITGFVVERSLSADNIFVIAMIFSFFGIPPMYQHRVLFWGIVGALVLRGAMIALGATLVAKFSWILIVFGVFLVFTGIKMFFLKSEDIDPAKNVFVRIARRFFPVTTRFYGEKFLVRAGSANGGSGGAPDVDQPPDEAMLRVKKGTVLLTPLAVALLTVETSDVIFAVDSIPAIFAITGDPFIVFTSNILSILGLRALYFALASMISMFRYLKASLALVLVLVGVKMLLAKWLHRVLGEHFSVYVLGVVLLILTAGVVLSIAADRRRPAARS